MRNREWMSVVVFFFSKQVLEPEGFSRLIKVGLGAPPEFGLPVREKCC